MASLGKLFHLSVAPFRASITGVRLSGRYSSASTAIAEFERQRNVWPASCNGRAGFHGHAPLRVRIGRRVCLQCRRSRLYVVTDINRADSPCDREVPGPGGIGDDVLHRRRRKRNARRRDDARLHVVGQHERQLGGGRRDKRTGRGVDSVHGGRQSRADLAGGGDCRERCDASTESGGSSVPIHAQFDRRLGRSWRRAAHGSALRARRLHVDGGDGCVLADDHRGRKRERQRRHRDVRGREHRGGPDGAHDRG